MERYDPTTEALSATNRALIDRAFQGNRGITKWLPADLDRLLDAARREGAGVAIGFDSRVHVPGVWRCAKCSFRLIQSNLNARDGTVTAQDEAGERCPNCGVSLWRVTWREEAEDCLRNEETVWERGREAGMRHGWSDAAYEILNERRRQIEVEGWTPEHDDEHEGGELAHAAACYARGSSSDWPWDMSWWKPGRDYRRRLVKAAALIIAEIERLDRLPATGGGDGR